MMIMIRFGHSAILSGFIMVLILFTTIQLQQSVFSFLYQMISIYECILVSFSFSEN